MTTRLTAAVGRHWGGLVHAIDVIYGVTAFGPLGGLPPLVHAMRQSARYAVKRLTSLKRQC